MSEALVDKLARALLYEGYVLYPYRPSMKNQQRWTFGGVYPPSWSAAQEGTDACIMQTQCLLESGTKAHVQVKVRFLHLTARTIGELSSPLEELPAQGEPAYQEVRSLDIGEKRYQAWQEAVEREVDLGEVEIADLLEKAVHHEFSFSSQRTVEPLRASGAPITAILLRQQHEIRGTVELSAVLLEKELIRLTVRIVNRTEMTAAQNAARDDALMRAFISTHTIIETQNAKLISLTDPPDKCITHAKDCMNIGTWPVLVGTPGECRTMLSSPIIIEDYPKIAPESPGDLFDSGEIDEILTLRIMTLTDEEKRLAAGVDERVAALLARTQSLAREELMNLHGHLRPVEQLPAERAYDIGGMSGIKKVSAHGVELTIGDSVRLRPLGRADVMDLVLDGKTATIASIEQDFENRIYVAVTIDDDPGKDLGLRGQPGHRFFFGIEEIEPLPQEEAAI